MFPDRKVSVLEVTRVLFIEIRALQIIAVPSACGERDRIRPKIVRPDIEVFVQRGEPCAVRQLAGLKIRAGLS